MNAIMLFAAKRGIFSTLAAGFDEDDGVQVSYSFPPNGGRVLIYGAAARMVRQQGAAEWGAIVQEAVTVDIWLRVVDPTSDVEASDRVLEDLAGRVIAVLDSNRAIGNGLTFADVVFGLNPEALASPNPDPTITARLQMQALVQAVTV